MATLSTEDASEVEGVHKKKDVVPKKERDVKQADENDNKVKLIFPNNKQPQPSKKSGWGTEGTSAPAE